MNVIKNPSEDQWPDILKRPTNDVSDLFDSVQKILDEVKSGGDQAVKYYSGKFDKVAPEELQCSKVELTAAKYNVDDSLKKAIDEARGNIEKFHARQLCETEVIETTPGVRCWQKTVPIEKVGLYIPGGTAPLLSTVLMLGIPAKLAGCSEVILCTPPDEKGNIDPSILYLADLLDIDKVFRVGGVQAIAAMAYGTESIPAVNKIFGPGNQYVTAAKQLVSQDSVAIDMPAGPSELAVIADKTAIPEFIASDLLSQAEHGIDSQVILITDSDAIIEKVQIAIEQQLTAIPRKDIAVQALLNSKIVLMEDPGKMIKMMNAYAPEHLIIACENYQEMAEKVVNAGSVFLGNYTPESAGDYASGTNHTLPTNGWAHAYSGLNMDSFVKKITFQEISKYGLFNISQAVTTMAAAEALDAHKNAVEIRLKNGSEE